MADMNGLRSSWEFPKGSIGYINLEIRKELATLAIQEPATPDTLTQDNSTQGEQ